MPVANVRGVNIYYQVIGDRGPWVALITGGRRGHDEFVPLAHKLAQAGYRVVHDCRTPAARRADRGRRRRGDALARRPARLLTAQCAAGVRQRFFGRRPHRDADFTSASATTRGLC
jgi:predicted kinase